MRKMIYFISIVAAIFIVIVVGDIEYYYITGQNLKTSTTKSDAESNVQYLNTLNDCMQFQTLDSLTNCKIEISHIKELCKNSDYSSMEVCNDSRIEGFLETVDFKIAAAHNQASETSLDLNNSISYMINLCSQSYIPTCQTNMIELKQECGSTELNAVQACKDPRINQIISRSINHTVTSPDYFQDQVLSFINMCSKAMGNSTITTCAITAREVMSLCHSANTAACNDDRLQQMANMGLNSVIISEIRKMNSKLQTTLDNCYSKMSNQTECTNSLYIINESCNGNFKQYFPVCYDPRIQNLTKYIILNK